MEIELKYLIDDSIDVEAIFSDPKIAELVDGSTVKVIPMSAVYFDTTAGDLQRNVASLRLRMEGCDHTLTAKWGGGAGGGLHRRHEVNVNIKEAPPAPSIECLKGTLAYESYKQILGDKPLVPIVKMTFERTECHMKINNTQCVFSIDIGTINGIQSNEKIREIEIELYSGKEEDMLLIGNYLQEKYHATPSNVSKLARGLKLNGLR